MAEAPDWTETFELAGGELTVIASSANGEPTLIFRPSRDQPTYLLPWREEIHEAVLEAWATSCGHAEPYPPQTETETLRRRNPWPVRVRTPSYRRGAQANGDTAVEASSRP